MKRELFILSAVLFVITTATAFMILLVPVAKPNPTELADELLYLRKRVQTDLHSRRYDEAAKSLRQLHTKWPRDLVANRLLVRFHYETDQLDAAEKLVLKLLRKFPADALLTNDLGCILLARGELDEAEKQLRRAAKGQENAPEILLNLAVLLETRGDLTGAAKYRNAATLLTMAGFSRDNGEFILAERRQTPGRIRFIPAAPAFSPCPDGVKETTR